MPRLHRDERGQSLVIVLSLITIMFLLGSSLAVHSSVALRSTRASESQGDEFHAADAATELGIWWQRNGKAGNPPAQTINGVTTSTTISTAGGGGGSCPAAPSIKWMSGFESGVIYSTANSVAGGFYIVSGSGQVSAVATPVRTGNYALKVAPTSSGGAHAILMDPYGNLGNTLVVHVSIRLDVLPTTDATVFSLGPNGATGWAHSTMYLFYKLSSGKWALGLGNTTMNPYQESTVTVATGTWYGFDFRMQVIGTDTRMAEWYLDGVAQPTVSVVDSPGTGGAGPRINFGQVSVLGSPYTAYYDDAIISSTPGDFPIGDIKISPLKPNGFGTHVNPNHFTTRQGFAPSATDWQLLDDSPMANNIDFLRQVTANASSYLEVALQDTTQTCIRGAATEMSSHPEGTSANNTKASTFDGATESILYQGDNSILNTALAFAIRPITPGGAWTQARVNGLKLRFGYGVDVNPVLAWDDFHVLAAWSTVAGGPATVTIVGTAGGATITTDYLDAGAGVPTLNNWATTK